VLSYLFDLHRRRMARGTCQTNHYGHRIFLPADAWSSRGAVRGEKDRVATADGSLRLADRAAMMLVRRSTVPSGMPWWIMTEHAAWNSKCSPALV
jgi:hypothetical protein